MDKKNLQQSRGGRSKKDAMTAAAATSNKNIHQNEVFQQFELLALRDDRTVSAKSKTTMKSSDDVDVTLRKKMEEETSSAAVDVSPSSKQQPKKSYRRNSGGKKRGSKKNVLGVKPPAVVVEISEATVAPLNRKSGGGKNKKKNFNRKKESVAAAQDVENISANIHYGSYDGIYPEHYYHDLGYYYQDYYYQNFDCCGYPVYEDEMAYHYQYGNMPTAMADQPPALNIDAPSFEPTGQHL